MCTSSHNGVLADQRDNQPCTAEELRKAADELMKKKHREMEFLRENVR